MIVYEDTNRVEYGDWIKHDGKSIPQELIGKRVIKKYRDGEEWSSFIDEYDLTFIWSNKYEPEDDVIAYKVIS